MTSCWSYRPALIPPLKHLAAICHSSPGVGSQAAHSGTPGSPPPTPRPDFPPALTAPHVPSAEVLLSSEGGGRSSDARFYPLLALRPLLPLRPEAHAARSRRQLLSQYRDGRRRGISLISSDDIELIELDGVSTGHRRASTGIGGDLF